MLRLARASLLAVSLLATACDRPSTSNASSGAASVVRAAPPAPSVYSEVLSTDSTRTTRSGAIFTGPRGWTLTRDRSLVVLEPPEHDSKIAIVDVNAPNPKAAVAAAWATYRPSAKRELASWKGTRGRGGWDEWCSFSYVQSAKEPVDVRVVALRDGKNWTVVITEAMEATRARREAAFDLAEGSVHPAGVTLESFAGRTAHPLDAERIQQIENFVESARRRFGVPGIAISLIEAGKIVFEGGFGVRELGKPAPVGADTLFQVASNVKPLTTLLIAKLVDEGKLTWHTPVTEVYPGFKLGDAETTRRVQIKDLVCACMGMPRQDLEWVFDFHRFTPKKAIDLLGTLQPTTKFGEVFQYSNLPVAAAGFIAGHVLYPDRELGEAYDEAMRTRVFEPLGMKATTFNIERAQRGDHARPHGDDIDGHPAVASMDVNHSMIPQRPAGGAWSNVRDLATYVQMELSLGQLPDGTRYVSEDNLLARRAPGVTAGEHETYGLGLMIERSMGIPVVHHGGSMFGYRSELFFLPEQGVGLVILTNSDTGESVIGPIMRRVIEVMFDGVPKALDDLNGLAFTRRQRITEHAHLDHPPNAAAAAKLAARYTNEALGELTVKKRGGALVFDVGEWSSAVGSSEGSDGLILFSTIDPAKHVSFLAGEQDGKRTLTVHDPQHQYIFVEKR